MASGERAGAMIVTRMQEPTGSASNFKLSSLEIFDGECSGQGFAFARMLAPIHHVKEVGVRPA